MELSHEEYLNYTEIFNSLVALGLHESAFYLSILLNKTIQIKEPKIEITPLNESLPILAKKDTKYITSVLDYWTERTGEGEENGKGLLIFVFSEYNEKKLTEMQSTLMDKLQKCSQEIADSIIKENSNILSGSILKTISNKTSITLIASTPELYTGYTDELKEVIKGKIIEDNIDTQKSIVVETAFIDDENEVQLSLIIIPGNTYDILLNKLIENRIY